MHAIHENKENPKVDLHEQYEQSVLAPLRRRLSDVGSNATPIVTSSAKKLSLPSKLLTDNNQLSEKCKEENKIASPNSSDNTVTTTCQTKATADSPTQSQQTKKLKSWYVFKLKNSIGILFYFITRMETSVPFSLTVYHFCTF